MRTSIMRGALAVLALLAGLALAGGPVHAGTASSTFNATGTYCVADTGTSFTKGLIHLTEDGAAISGTYGHGGAITGTLKGTGAKATWTDQRGTGWMKLSFTPAGRDFSGTWGLKGKASSGDIKATRIAAGTTSASACP